MIQAKITKIETFKNTSKIEDGREFNGYLASLPKIGESIYLYNVCTYSNKTILRTSIVQEIVDNNTFKTKNSTYRIVTKSDEREELISSILD